jgi:hypothetical protein
MFRPAMTHHQGFELIAEFKWPEDDSASRNMQPYEIYHNIKVKVTL